MTRDAYLSCQDSRPFDLLGVEVLDEYPERNAVAGLGEQDSIAVTIKVTLTSNGRELSDTDTYHAYTANDRWYVAADDERFACAKA